MAKFPVRPQQTQTRASQQPRTTADDFGAGVGIALQQGGAAVSTAAGKRLKVKQRLEALEQKRIDRIDDAFNAHANTVYKSNMVGYEADLENLDDAQKLMSLEDTSQVSTRFIDNALQNYQGSQKGKERLHARLLNSSSDYLTAAETASRKLSWDMTDKAIKNMTSTYSNVSGEMPHTMGDQLSDYEEELEVSFPSLDGSTLINVAKQGKAEIVKSAITALQQKGMGQEAMDLMDAHNVTDFMTAGDVRTLRNKNLAIEHSNDSIARKYDAVMAKAESAGIVYSESEKASILAGQKMNKPTNEIVADVQHTRKQLGMQPLGEKGINQLLGINDSVDRVAAQNKSIRDLNSWASVLLSGAGLEGDNKTFERDLQEYVRRYGSSDPFGNLVPPEIPYGVKLAAERLGVEIGLEFLPRDRAELEDVGGYVDIPNISTNKVAQENTVSAALGRGDVTGPVVAGEVFFGGTPGIGSLVKAVYGIFNSDQIDRRERFKSDYTQELAALVETIQGTRDLGVRAIAEIERIESRLRLDPAFFDTNESAANRMQGVLNYLIRSRGKLAAEMRTAREDKVKHGIVNTVRGIDNFMEYVGDIPNLYGNDTLTNAADLQVFADEAAAQRAASRGQLAPNQPFRLENDPVNDYTWEGSENE